MGRAHDRATGRGCGISRRAKTAVGRVRRERDASIRNIASQVAKGIAVLIALLILWAIFRVIRRGVGAEQGDDPLGVLIAMRTEARAQELGKTLVEENLAMGGTVAPSIRSIYRREDGVREAAEAMVFLKTTRAQLSHLIGPSRGIGWGQDARTRCDT